MGWENYLESDYKRQIYKPHEHAADIIFASLYSMCIIGAFVYNKNEIEIFSLNIIIFFYMIAGILYLLDDIISQ